MTFVEILQNSYNAVCTMNKRQICGSRQLTRKCDKEIFKNRYFTKKKEKKRNQLTSLQDTLKAFFLEKEQISSRIFGNVC